MPRRHIPITETFPDLAGHLLDIGKEFKHRKFSTLHSDIWSLGIILTNMIANRNPWRYAMTTDDCFSAFLYSRDFLRSTLPISDQANRVLKHIFHLNPHNRISIPELRREILAVDTFFAFEKEQAPQKVPEGSKTPVEPLPAESSSPFPRDSEEVYLYARPTDYLQPLPDHPHNSCLDAFIIGSKKNVSASISEPESTGPITPESRPVDEPLVEVPELSPEQLGGEVDFITFHTVQPASKPIQNNVPRHRAPSNTAPKPPPRRVGKQLFKKAVQRFKGFKSLSESVSS